LSQWLGESEKNAKAVFTLARRLAPCVVFIDEVDSLLSSREHSDDSAHGTLTSVKTTMMAEWDGLNSGTNGEGVSGGSRVVVIGSTNRPFDLDEAVLRRFPRRILVDLPDLVTRTEILEVTMQNNRVAKDVNFTKIAEKLEGYTGSDIKEVCREAVVRISHEQASKLDKGVGLEDGEIDRLRDVEVNDFERAMKKLKKSVSEKGKELSKVYNWNNEYGELKRKKKKSGGDGLVSSMFL
jgi:ATPase family AAA domain-containing protein 1